MSDWEELYKKNRFYFQKSPKGDLSDPSFKPNLPNPEQVLANLRQIDLTDLRELNLKGGEPFINSEVEATLRYLDLSGILPNVAVAISTNGTVYNERVLNLLARAKSVLLNVSVDGVGALNEYIRYGKSHTDLIESNIAQFNLLENIRICRVTSIMNYNLSNLIQIRDWWFALSKKYKKMIPLPDFSLLVFQPRWLDPNVLSDNYRAKIRNDLIQAQRRKEFTSVIKTLELPWTGPEHHNRWVQYTRDMEDIRKNNILNLVPDLTDELQFCDKNSPIRELPAKITRSFREYFLRI